MIIRELTIIEYESRIPRLGAILIDAVDAGAGVTFLHPLSKDVAEAYWRKQVPEIGSGQTLQFVAEERNCQTPAAQPRQRGDRPQRVASDGV